MRKHYLDNIRWITVLLVVLYHVIYIYAAVQQELSIGPFRDFQIQDGVLYFLYPWFMILLFVVSGACARYYLQNHSVKQFIGSRTRKLLVPSTIGLFVFQWILGWFSMNLYGGMETMPETVPAPVKFVIMSISGTGPLWYIQALWVISLIAALVHKCEKKGKIYTLCEKGNLPVCLALILPLWGAAQIFNTPVILVYRMGIYTLSFFLGYFIFAQEQVLRRLSRYWHVLLGSAVIIGIVYAVHYFGENFAAPPILSNIFSITYAWIMVLAIFASMYRFGNWDNRFTRYMNSQSFGIYVFHYLMLSMVAYFLGKPRLVPGWLCYILSGAACIFGSILLYEVISRIPVIRWCVLGMKKEKKNVR